MTRLLSIAILVAGICSGVEFRKGQGAHIVVTPKTQLEKRLVGRLSAHLSAVLGKEPTLLRDLARVPGGAPAILFIHPGEKPPFPVSVPSTHPEAFALATGKAGGRSLVTLAGSTDLGLKRAVQKLILASRQSESGLEIPDMKISEQPWVREREWTVCPWVPRHVRGAFVNPYADNRMDITLYSDKQLADYVEMYDWFGFSGVQLMETSYSYGVLGSPEALHARQRSMARSARENGQNVSLWVWAAEFSGHGWVDLDVVYEPAQGSSAFEDPDVRRGFEKYYDLYAELAPYVDRLIGHFYDPGHLRNRQDVFRYMRLLEKKFRAKNPKVQMAIDSWGTRHDYLKELIANGFTDYLILEMSMPSFFKPGQREAFHEEARRLNLKLGVWGWYTTEYESDQMPSMHVNAQVLRHFYQQMKKGALEVHPVQYWSEMEAHHLNNIYSMYAAGRLLWDPERDPDELLGELTEAIWGPRNGPRVLQALKLVQDARSGPSWDTYWWTLPGYRLGTEDPAGDLARADSVLESLRGMKTDSRFVPKIPLPFPPDTFIRLMLPHLEQIKAFAQFRLELADIRKVMAAGASKQDLSERLARSWRPIPDFDTWIGTFGQPEARMQEILLRKLAKEAGIELDEPAWLRSRDGQRLLQKIQAMQRAKRGEWQFKARQVNEGLWPAEKLQSRMDKLVADGSVQKVGPDTYRLTNWGHFAR